MVDANSRVLWMSLDPVRRVINFYPSAIAQRIESARQRGADSCVLGADFFNATIHFPEVGSLYQTTPGQHMGRSGFKAPGYRSVRRVLHPVDMETVTVWGRRVHGEWRICDSEGEAEFTFVETVPPECLLDPDCTSSDTVHSRPWCADDLQAEGAAAQSTQFITWQWCRGTAEVHGDLMRLADEMWCPYMQEHNASIERAFAAHEEDATIDIDGRELRVTFTPGSTFALQRDVLRHKERAVRRVMKTVQEISAMHRRMQAQESQIAGEESHVPFSGHESAPVEFFCPITQDVMREPVCTVDWHTYERVAIDTWFINHNTSPLTGLALPSLALRPNLGLQQQITAWRAAQAASNGNAA